MLCSNVLLHNCKKRQNNNNKNNDNDNDNDSNNSNNIANKNDKGLTA